MVAESLWLAASALATLMTIAWLFVPIRIVLTGLLAGGTWAFVAVSGGSITRYTQTGAEIAIDAGVLQYLATGLAVLSFTAVVMHLFGHYPPDSEGETDPSRVNPDVAD